MKSKMFLPLFSTAFLFMILVIPPAFAEGGGGLDCPESSNGYSYLSGSAKYETKSFENGEIATLYCEYMRDVIEGNELELFGEINIVYHTSGELSQELIDEYGCGAVLAEQFSSTYVSSATHFASSAFSITPLQDVAQQVLSQVEEQSLASLCLVENAQSTIEVVKEAIEEHEEIEDTTTDILIEEMEIVSTPSIMETEIILPEWIKNNAGWWSSGEITDDDFADGIEFMINNGFIQIPISAETSESVGEIPEWVKNNAAWWSQDLISDEDFVNGLQFLISAGIISVA